MALENPFAVLGGVLGAIIASYYGYLMFAKPGEPFSWSKFALKAIPAAFAGMAVGYASQDLIMGLMAGFTAKQISEDIETKTQ